MKTPRTDAFASVLRGLGTGYHQALELARTLETELETWQAPLKHPEKPIYHHRRHDVFENGIQQERYEIYKLRNLTTIAMCYLPEDADRVIKALTLLDRMEQLLA